MTRRKRDHEVNRLWVRPRPAVLATCARESYGCPSRESYASASPGCTAVPEAPTEPSAAELTPEDQQILKQAELLHFEETGQNEAGIPYTHQEYLDLVDWSGRALRAGKRGAIQADLPPILSRLGIDVESLVDHLRGDTNSFVDVIGQPAAIKRALAIQLFPTGR